MINFFKKNPEIQVETQPVNNKPFVIDLRTIQSYGVKQDDGNWIVDISNLEPGTWKVFVPVGSVYFIGVNQKVSLSVRRSSCYFSECVMDTLKAEFCPRLNISTSSFAICEISYSRVWVEKTDLGNGKIEFSSITVLSESQYDGSVRLCSVTEDVNVQTY